MDKVLKRYGLVLLLISITVASATAQNAAAAGQMPSAAGGGIANLQLAISSHDYPVTLGDVYRLGYRSTNGNLITMDVQIDGTGMVSLGVFGKLDANGLTFVELKRKVEDLISKNYSHSLPELTIVSPGVFRIVVRDGSSMTQYAAAWGLSRLSEIVKAYKSDSTSMRNVEMTSKDGVLRRYDLLSPDMVTGKVLDPLVKPGDTITLHEPVKSVRLEGEVRRPGTYELLDAEGLRDLLEVFGGGLTNQADVKRIRIDRSASIGGKTEYVSLPEGYTSGLLLGDGDTILVRASSDLLPIIWFEGAVLDPSFIAQGGNGADNEPLASSAQSAAPAASQTPESMNNRFSYTIREGQMLSDALQDVRAYFQPMADLSYASFFSSSESLSGSRVDIPALLSGTNMSTDLPLTPGARIVIPTVCVTVMVSGAVYAPGAVLFRPNSPAAYYMIQAGGIDPWRNSWGSYTVYNKDGKKRKKAEPIQPGDQIHVKENNLYYQLERRVPVLTSILALTTSIITLTLVYGP